MASITLSVKDRQELPLLMPWYAKGTLDTGARDRVVQALAEYYALAPGFDLSLSDQAGV